MRFLQRKLLFALVLLLSAILLGCSNRDLRGWWKPSDDGKTYLVVEDDDSGRSADSRCTLDGRPWPHPVGQRGDIERGKHELGCPAKIGFAVKAGDEYHFDYWGP